MRRFVFVLLAVAGISTMLLVRPASGATQQFQWFDNVVYHTSSSYATPTESAATPANWTSPVNYANGRVFVRFQVLEKPTDYTLTVQICVWRHGTKRFQYEACSRGATRFSTEGTYWIDMGRPNDWWEKDGAWSWAHDIDVVRFMIKDPANGKLVQSSSCGAYCHPSSTFVNNNTPMKFDGSAVVVAPGATLVPPSSKWNACPGTWSPNCGGSGTPTSTTTSTTSTTVKSTTTTTTSSNTTTTVSGSGNDVAFIVSNASSLPSKDRATRDRLQALGKTVTLVDDDRLGSSSALGGADLVVVSSSVVPTKIPSWLASHGEPILSMEAYIQRKLKIGTTQTEVSSKTTLRIVNSSHTLAAGRSGDVVVQSAVRMAAGTPVRSATVIARIPGASTASVYAIETGDALTSGNAPAPRVALFTSYDSPPAMNANGWALFDAAVRWLD